MYLTCIPHVHSQKPFGWNNVFSAYVISICLVTINFAGSPDSSYTTIIIVTVFMHFTFETIQSWHFIYSGKTALYLSRITFAIGLVEVILIFFFRDIMFPTIFVFQYVVMDSFSFITAICFMANYAIPTKLKKMAFSVTLHMIGAFLALYYIPLTDSGESPHIGASWTYLGLASLPQIWLCQDVIRGEMNHYGPVLYDETKNSKWFILFAKYGSPLLAFVVVPLVAYGVRLFVPEHDNDDHIKFAVWIWDDVIHVISWPVGMFGFLWVLYLRLTFGVGRNGKEL